MQDCKIIYVRSSKEFFGVFSVCCSVWQNWGKESEGGWVALSRRALSFETNHAFELLVQKRLEFELVAHQS
tara:strand:- start:405 stop:617 length:213 start_codon:yes stop_codon:yes gene_type:complete